MQQTVTVIEHIVKEYPSMYKVTLFNNPLIISRPRPGYTPKRNVTEPSEIALQESLRRTRATIQDYALANNFTHFVTFTFNPKKIDRYSWETTSNTMKYWLNRQKTHSPDFAYVIVPEHHKDGAIHFHALIKGYSHDLKKTNVYHNGKRVYNVTGFTSGFTTAQELDPDSQSAAAYLTKYITKELTQSEFNKRRYWASKNLIKPIKHYESLHDLRLSAYITDENLTYHSDQYNLSIYQFSRNPKIDTIYNLLTPTPPDINKIPPFKPRQISLLRLPNILPP